ncbi:hypothetical protein FA95DRAFT_1561210 [Auriscalpium vulgare]|uniref:Uncharacterized protein n=1 Tax=Auriscalpium vulgare TaxID=40419 RepID=A0ACB8RMC9_9AGAM|nr:hypothetical protein FA95DRAFT_1561210 [Auriscalpium vulgare]
MITSCIHPGRIDGVWKGIAPLSGERHARRLACRRRVSITEGPPKVRGHLSARRAHNDAEDGADTEDGADAKDGRCSCLAALHPCFTSPSESRTAKLSAHKSSLYLVVPRNSSLGIQRFRGYHS